MIINIKTKLKPLFIIFSTSALMGILAQCAAVEKNKSNSSVLDEVKTIMTENFYDQSRLSAFFTSLENIKNNPTDDWIDDLKYLLDKLHVSHTGFYTPDELEYYEQLDIYKFGHEEKLKTLFPPDGIIRYPGVGIAPRFINGRYFVDFIYANTPAAGADILHGDELLTVDGQEYSPIKAFRGKVGQTVKLTLRREQGGDQLEREVMVEALNPTETFITSTAASARIIKRGSGRFGYIGCILLLTRRLVKF